MENKILLIFCGMLALCVAGHVEILWALTAGLILFCGYAWFRGHSWKAVAGMSVSGLGSTKNVLLTFALIGMLTGLWRLSGTLPVILQGAIAVIGERNFLLMTFLLNCGVSLLTGTALGTTATMGSICGVVGTAMGVPPALTGGAVLSGAFFGDRCSPVSSTALLVSEVTETDLGRNIRGMLKSARIPFLLSCGIYLLLDRQVERGGELPDVGALFTQHFSLSWICLLPAIVILLLPLLGVKMRWTLLVSIGLSAFVAIWVQGSFPLAILKTALLGYTAPSEELGAMMNGGGVISMLRVSAILCVSSGYAGIFKETGLLSGFQAKIISLSQTVTPFGAITCVAAFTGAIACNQPLSVLLTGQLCEGLIEDREKYALALANTAVVLVPLIPWSVACTATLSAVEAPVTSIFAACFLYLLPLWEWGKALRQQKKK